MEKRQLMSNNQTTDTEFSMCKGVCIQLLFSSFPFKVLMPIALYGFCFKIQPLSFIINSLLNVRNYLLLLVFMLLCTFCPVTNLTEHLNMHLRVLLNRHRTRSVLLCYLLITELS